MPACVKMAAREERRDAEEGEKFHARAGNSLALLSMWKMRDWS